METVLEKMQDQEKVVVDRAVWESKNSTLQYDVSIEQAEDTTYTARVLAWPDCIVTGKTRDEVITRIRHKIVNRLAQSEIITIEVEPAIIEHSWRKFAGTWANNPLMDEFMADLEQIRKEANELDYDDEIELERMAA